MKYRLRIQFYDYLIKCFLLSAAILLNNIQPAHAQADGAPAKVDAVFAQFEKPGSPGCAVGIYKNGSLLYSKGYGEADLERGVRITPATVFQIGSTAKQFTAASVWLLAQRNKLSLDDDVRKFIPELPDYGAPIKIRHLLYHTSGLRDYTNLLELAGHRNSDTSTQAEVVELITRQKRLNFPTGTVYQYSNSNYVLLAEIIKKISGQPLLAFTKANIFEPLGMKNTQFVDDHKLIIPNRAIAYEELSKSSYAISMSNAERVGSAGLYTTVEDLMLWDQNFYTGKVGGKALIESMVMPGDLADGKRLDYAFGLMLGTYKGVSTIRHAGSFVGYRAELLRFPTLGFTVATLCNVPSNPRSAQLSEQVAEVYLIGRLPNPEQTAVQPTDEKPVTLSADEIGDALGDYWNPKTGETRRMVMRNNKPVYQIDSGSRARLTTFGPTKFRFGKSEINIILPPQGKKMLSLKWYDGREETYEELKRVDPTPSYIASYTGCFYSEELNAEYKIEAHKEGINLKRKNREDMVFLPTIKDKFSEGSVRLRFTRNGNGNATGFFYSDEKMSDIQFRSGCR
jgi:CubicO group peptidase (beta-lactamase class C family)